MEPILFYGVPQGCSFGSIVALEWLGEPYRLARVNMPDDMQTELYARLNPVRETPTLITAVGDALSESAAILNHIAARGIDKGLGFKQGVRAFDELNQMIAFLNTGFFSAFTPLWVAYEGNFPDSEREFLRALGRKAVAKAHAELETFLAGREWLLGAQRTVADAYLTGIARWTDYHKAIDRRDYPRVHALIERLAADPAVQFAHAIEAERPAVSSGGFLGHVTIADAAARLAA